MGEVIPKHILLKSEHTVVAFRKSVKPSPLFPTTHSRFRSSPLAFFFRGNPGFPLKEIIEPERGQRPPHSAVSSLLLLLTLLYQ